MLDSNEALVEELIKRNRLEDAQFYITSMVFDAYFTMNKPEWINQQNKKYRNDTQKRFKKYFVKFKKLFNSIPEEKKVQIIMNIKNRMFSEGLVMETITFEDWIKFVMKKY